MLIYWTNRATSKYRKSRNSNSRLLSNGSSGILEWRTGSGVMRAERGGADKPNELLLLREETISTGNDGLSAVMLLLFKKKIVSKWEFCSIQFLWMKTFWHTCSWGLYHCRSFPQPESAGTAEQSDLAAVCWDPCDLLAWSPVTVATTDAVHQPTAPGTSFVLLNEPPCRVGPLKRNTRWQENL